MINDLLLLSGNDIPFQECGVIIHQPTIKEIAYIGEECFYSGCELLNFSKDILLEEDKIHLEGLTNFDVLMSIINDKNLKKNKVYIEMLLTLIFPQYKISFDKNKGIKLENENTNEKYFINNNNFEIFKSIMNAMFAIEKSQDDFSPEGDMAKRISDKLKKRHQQLSKKKEDDGKRVVIISRYVSILAVGEHKDMNSLMQYTVYQLFDEFKRYELKMSFDMNIKAKLDGAKDLKDAEDWMQDIHSNIFI